METHKHNFKGLCDLISEIEDGPRQVDITQIREVVHCALVIFNSWKPSEIHKLIEKYQGE